MELASPVGDQPLYSIGRVAKLTGLAPSTLRAWEELYGLLSPLRSPRGTRLYSPQDLDVVRRIQHLHREEGLHLSVIASLLGLGAPGAEPLRRESPPPLRAEDLERLFNLAREAGVAIENARLLARERRRSAALEAVTAVQHRLTTALTQEESLPHIAAVIQKELDLTGVAIFTWDGAADQLQLAAAAGGVAAAAMPELRLRPRQHGPNQRAVRTGKPQPVPDLRREGRGTPRPLFPGARSELAVPVLLRGQIMGTLDVYRSEVAGFDDTDLCALGILAEQVALVLEASASFAHERRLNRQLVAALEVSAALSAELHPDRLLELIARHAGELSGAATTAVPVRCRGEQGETIRYAAAWGRHRVELTGLEVPLEQAGFCGWVITHQEPLLTDRAPKDPRANRDLLLHLKVSTALVVPLISPDGVEGGLTALDKADGGKFTAADLHLFQLFANHAAVALRNARLVSHIQHPDEGGESACDPRPGS
ncbi:MAG: GAF domain-containing protein [Thermaerobacter sp.]|nr:GAF domain-containing protein [Thermaerobacter sp.]